jgi:hypothetical protein
MSREGDEHFTLHIFNLYLLFEKGRLVDYNMVLTYHRDPKGSARGLLSGQRARKAWAVGRVGLCCLRFVPYGSRLHSNNREWKLEVTTVTVTTVQVAYYVLYTEHLCQCKSVCTLYAIYAPSIVVLNLSDSMYSRVLSLSSYTTVANLVVLQYRYAREDYFLLLPRTIFFKSQKRDMSCVVCCSRGHLHLHVVILTTTEIERCSVLYSSLRVLLSKPCASR